MSYQHAIVWLDHHAARVIDFSVDDKRVVTIEREGGQRKVHLKATVIGSGKAKEDHHYFDEIVAALGDVREILITGPGSAKTEFSKDLAKRHADVAKRVLGVESLDHPSDSELVAFARKSFKRIDALRGNS
jgi:stalled ribosome rescue protein Dom34